MQTSKKGTPVLAAVWISIAIFFNSASAQDEEARIDYLSFAQGVTVLSVAGDAAALKFGIEHALQALDGNSGTYSLTRKPGDADTKIEFYLKLPALTTFSEFAIPNVLETPSPSQTFIKEVKIFGSTESQDTDYTLLAQATLETHSEKNQLTQFPAVASIPVRWVKVELSGGIKIERAKTFLEFSELIAYGTQEVVPLDEGFTGKWKGRGVLLELKQNGSVVSGCYDKMGDLKGTVSGNVLRSIGTDRNTGVKSAFVININDKGEIDGVRSTNGAPFRRYFAPAAAKNIETGCSEPQEEAIGCGAVLHGINFDYDSATIRPDSKLLIDQLYQGLSEGQDVKVTIEGHTSSEGSAEYNQSLSERRAQALVEELISRGIKASSIKALGKGETTPIADNKDEAGRSLNRRVEVHCL